MVISRSWRNSVEDTWPRAGKALRKSYENCPYFGEFIYWPEYEHNAEIQKPFVRVARKRFAQHILLWNNSNATIHCSKSGQQKTHSSVWLRVYLYIVLDRSKEAESLASSAVREMRVLPRFITSPKPLYLCLDAESTSTEQASRTI